MTEEEDAAEEETEEKGDATPPTLGVNINVAATEDGGSNMPVFTWDEWGCRARACVETILSGRPRELSPPSPPSWSFSRSLPLPLLVPVAFVSAVLPYPVRCVSAVAWEEREEGCFGGDGGVSGKERTETRDGDD